MFEINNEDYRAGQSTKEAFDDDDDDCGSSPSELYGWYTWKIDKFSEIDQRDIRSNVFDVGGYNWYIVAYPRGCDVCNHLSLFLCVANHEKLLPGWSHLALFTINVVNKDPKKSKYSDALHQFCKKERNWGWKKVIELPKLQEGFIDDSDSLIIKAQIQVIRDNVDRPFRCLDGLYRTELARVYLSHVEKDFISFIEEKRSIFLKLIKDKMRWTSLCAFWLGMDQNLRQKMSREKMDVILKLVVKHFFIKKEVKSTFAMDFLFYGLNSLEGKTKKERIIHKISKLVVKHLFIDKKVASPLVKDSLHSRLKTLEEETKKERAIYLKKWPAPIVSVDDDMFVLVDDAMLLIEKAVLEPLPEKGPQIHMMVGNIDYNMELDDKRLSEFARRTLEVFVLEHIFCSKIEVAYKEAIKGKKNLFVKKRNRKCI